MHTGPGLELRQWFRHWTAWPKQLSNGKWIWFDYYYEKRIYCDSEGIKPLRKPYWCWLYSKQEFLLEQLRGDINEPILEDIQQTRQEIKKRWWHNIHSRRDRGFGSGPKSSGS